MSSFQKNGTFTKVDHILGYENKQKITKCKRIETMQNVFPDHKGIRLKIGNRKITGKSLNTWKLNICGSENVSRRIRKYSVLNDNTVQENL